MSLYAEGTSVSSDRSQNEIRQILNAHGLKQFVLGEAEDRIAIHAVLERDGQKVSLRFVLLLPSRDAPKITGIFRRRNGRTFRVGTRTADGIETLWNDECRRRWRCLVVMLKAKFAAINSGITTFQDEFLAHMVLSTGERVGDWASREIGPALINGGAPANPLLPTVTR